MDREELLRRHKRVTTRSSGSQNKRQFKPKAGGGADKDGKFQVRLMPWNPNDSQDEWRPFKDMYFHYGIARYGFLGLTQFDEKDPIQELINELKEDDPEGNKATLRKLYPKRRVFAAVIVRGEEEKGIQFWQFGPQVEEQLLNILLDEENDEVMDFKTGLDVKVSVTHPEGEDYPKTACSARRKDSPAGTAKQIKEWTADYPDLDEVYEKKTYAEVREILDKWHSPASSNDDEDEGTEHTAKAAKKASKEKASDSDISDDDDTDTEDIDEAFADLGPDA